MNGVYEWKQSGLDMCTCTSVILVVLTSGSHFSASPCPFYYPLAPSISPFINPPLAALLEDLFTVSQFYRLVTADLVSRYVSLMSHDGWTDQWHAGK